jgi:hypothetical protein
MVSPLIMERPASIVTTLPVVEALPFPPSSDRPSSSSLLLENASTPIAVPAGSCWMGFLDAEGRLVDEIGEK